MHKESYIISLLLCPIPTSALIQLLGDIKQEATVKAAQDNKIIFPWGVCTITVDIVSGDKENHKEIYLCLHLVASIFSLPKMDLH